MPTTDCPTTDMPTTDAPTTDAATTAEPSSSPKGCKFYKKLFRKKLACLQKTVRVNGAKLDKSYNFKSKTLNDMLRKAQKDLLKKYNGYWRKISYRYLYKTGCDYSKNKWGNSKSSKDSKDCSTYRRLYHKKRNLLAKIYKKKNHKLNVAFHLKLAKLSQILLTKRNELQSIYVEKRRDLERKILFKNGCKYGASCSNSKGLKQLGNKSCSCAKNWLQEIPFGFFDFGSFSAGSSWSKSKSYSKKSRSSRSKSKSESSCSESHKSSEYRRRKSNRRSWN